MSTKTQKQVLSLAQLKRLYAAVALEHGGFDFYDETRNVLKCSSVHGLSVKLIAKTQSVEITYIKGVASKSEPWPLKPPGFDSNVRARTDEDNSMYYEDTVTANGSAVELLPLFEALCKTFDS